MEYISENLTTPPATLIDKDFTIHPYIHQADCYFPPTLEKVSPLAQRLLFLLYFTTALLSFLGNGVVILVQLCSRKNSNHKIGKFLINLALSDCITVLCVPFSYTIAILGEWIFPAWLCPAAQFVQLLSVFVTSTTLSIIGIERYVSVLHPFTFACQWLKSHSNSLLQLTWAFGAIYAGIPASHTFAKPINGPEQPIVVTNRTYLTCAYDHEISLTYRRLYIFLNVLITFILPSLIILYSYVAICKRVTQIELQMRRMSSLNSEDCPSIEEFSALRPSPIKNIKDKDNCEEKLSDNGIYDAASPISIKENPIQRIPKRNSIASNQSTKRKDSKISFSSQCSNSLSKQRYKTIRIMVIVIIVFDLCWLPIKLFQFLLENELLYYCTEGGFYAILYGYLVCHWLAMANSFVNPIIYSFLSRNFRTDFKALFTSLKSQLACFK